MLFAFPFAALVLGTYIGDALSRQRRWLTLAAVSLAGAALIALLAANRPVEADTITGVAFYIRMLSALVFGSLVGAIVAHLRRRAS